MFGHRFLGEVLAPPSLAAEDLASMLAEGGHNGALVLAPSSERGWFGGRSLVAFDPVEVGSCTLEQAGEALQTAYAADTPHLCCVLAEYEGACHVARYNGALVLTDDGWRAWGRAPGAEQPCAAAARGATESDAPPLDGPLIEHAEWDLTGRDYRAAVEATREHIAAGDVYVLNLTARLSGTSRVPAVDAFRELVRRAPADFAAFARFGECAAIEIASVSPERFMRIVPGEDDARLVEVCPIKGTRPRGVDAEADDRFAQELLADAKERAEHIMVVDLERNDLGVSCTPGTIHVDPLYEIVGTPYCHQLVSTVRGTLRHDATFSEALSALFPCGSVTGAPRCAAIRIAAELERSPRGAYCGSLLVAMPGELDSSVLIRTLEVHAPGRAVWGAGCGITYESDPAAEYLELLLKASPVLGGGGPPVALRETMRVASGRVPLLDRHLARLALGGAGAGVLARVRAKVTAMVEAIGPDTEYARLGVTVTPDGEVAAGVSEEPSSLAVEGGPSIALVEVAGSPELPDAAAKPASRRYWDRAHRAAELRGADQALLIDAAGRVIDGSTANVWLVLGDGLVTPPAPPAVAGVAREVVFDIAAAIGMSVTVREATARELEDAAEVWLSNAVGGFVNARGRSGPVGRWIAREFERRFR